MLYKVKIIAAVVRGIASAISAFLLYYGYFKKIDVIK